MWYLESCNGGLVVCFTTKRDQYLNGKLASFALIANAYKLADGICPECCGAEARRRTMWYDANSVLVN